MPSRNRRRLIDVFGSIIKQITGNMKAYDAEQIRAFLEELRKKTV